MAKPNQTNRQTATKNKPPDGLCGENILGRQDVVYTRPDI